MDFYEVAMQAILIVDGYNQKILTGLMGKLIVEHPVVKVQQHVPYVRAIGIVLFYHTQHDTQVGSKQAVYRIERFGDAFLLQIRAGCFYELAPI